jgi:phage N-6-adenine-methyltransferase
MPYCLHCHQHYRRAKKGRPRDTYSNACRQAAYRKRQKRYVRFRRSLSVEWGTPPELFAELDAKYHFTLDAAATPENAKCSRYFTKEDDGLLQIWTGRVWCNSPYGMDAAKWMQKAYLSARDGTAEVVVCLVRARTDTGWWHQWATKGEIEYLAGRLRFVGPEEVESSALFPSALVVFRNAFRNRESVAETVTKWSNT